MQRRLMKATFTTLWILAVCAAAVTSGGMSGSAWLMLALVALLPPCLMARFWSDPPQATSESIGAVLR